MILSCITSTKLSVLWNREKLPSFKPERGLRQGDPLSPYLFVIYMECWGMEFKRQLITTNGKASKYLEMLRGYHTYFFADDLLLFGEASVAQARVMERILHDFCHTTGQKVNLAKSRIWYSGNTTHTMIHAITQHFGIPATSNPRLYLGVPIVHGRMTGHHFQFIID